MLKSRNLLDDLITLAVCRDADAAATIGDQSTVDDAPPSTQIAQSGFETSPTALTRPFAPVGVWGLFATQSLASFATPSADGNVELSGPIESMASRPPFGDAQLAGWIAPGAGDAGASPSWLSTAAQAWMTTDGSQAMASPSATPGKSGFSQKALATTQPQSIDFTSSPQGVFGTHTSFTFSLPSFLYQHYAFGIGASFAGFGLHAGASITGGVKGSVALSLGEFTPDYPVTIDPGVAPFVQDGQVFSIDPSLVSTNDAQFSLSLPQANASLDFGLQASAGVTLSFPSLRIGVTLPFVGFVGYTLSIPSQSVGFNAGNIYKLPSNSTISIPGDGTVTLSELQSKVVNSTPQSAYGSLPTLEMSGNTDPFFVADTDLVSILAQEVPDPFAALQGDESFYGLAGLSYKLLSLPLSGALWLNEDVTLTPIGITETVTDTLTGQQQSGPLGTSFNFTAPSSGSGIIPLSVTFGLDFSVHTTLELDGNVKLTLEGPSVSASILGVSGGVGPLGNFNLLDISGSLFQLYSNTFDETLTATTTVDVQTFASPVTKKVTGQSGPVSLTKPGTDLLVTARGTVTGSAYGVKTGTLSAADVTDYGLITANGAGVDLQEGGTVHVESGGRITATGATPGAGILVMGNAIDAVINAGAITGFSQGVSMIGGSLKNETGGRISATSVGVSIANPDASIVNNGYIHASTAVALNQGGSLYNALSGVISGATYGFYTQGVTSGIYITGAVAVENQCTITGGVAGVRALAGGGVTNLDGAYIHGGGTGVALSGDFRSTVTVTNGMGATISGGAVGVSLVGDYATLVDYGTISGSQVAVEMYGASTDTVVLGPDARLLGGIRFSPGFTNIRLEAGNGDVGALDLAGLSLVEQGHTFEFSGGVTIAAGAAWDISGDFLNAVVSGLNASDQLDDTAIAYSVGERAVVNASTDVLSIRAAGNPTVSLGTIHLTGTLNYAPIVTEGASGGVDISFSSQKLTTVSANNGEVYIAPSGFFGAEVTIAAGVLVSSNYYGYRAQSYAVLAAHERATLTNYGTVTGGGGGVVLRGGGLVVNEAGATISGSVGVDLRAISPDPTDTVSLINAGVISAVGNGVYINTPGTVTNTGLISSSALNGVQFNYDVGGSILNQGTITGGRSGLRMFDGGTVYNGASGLLATHAAYFFGVEISGAYGKVINLGTISSTGSAGVGVYLSDGGLVVNESGAITGKADGVKIAGAAGNIANAAYISGIRLANGGTIINAAGAVIGAVGGYGVSFYNRSGPFAAYVHNMGRIDGVLAFGGDTIVNDGTIDGAGVVAGSAGAVTVVNAGAIAGSGGVALTFSASSDRLIAETGSQFSGALKGGGGALELGGAGAVSVTGLGGAGRLSGAITATFSGFGQYAIDSGVTLTVSGPSMVAQGQTLTDNGVLTIGAGTTLQADGLVAIGGRLDLAGAILGLAGANAPDGAGGFGVELVSAGGVTLSGSISGGGGRNGYGANYRTQGGAGGDGIAGSSSATVTNNSGVITGGAGGTSAYYFGSGGGGSGGDGVDLGAGTVIDNGGRIAGGTGGSGVSDYDVGGSGGSGGAGVNLTAGGTVINVGGMISGGGGGAGGSGGYFGGTGGAGGAGVILAGGGEVINSAGIISGGAGAAGGSGGYSGGSGGAGGDGVVLFAGGMVVNGSNGAPAALIEGATGVYAGANGAATVINFGTIEGADGTAVQFNSAGDRLIVEVGSTWLGVVGGGGGALELAGGAGTITGLGGGGSLSGAETMTFSGFGSYTIDAGGIWALAGAHTLSANQTLTNAGTLTGVLALGFASDRLIVDAGSVVSSTVTGGGGVLEVAGGVGTITGLGATGTLSGAAALTFTGFGSYAVDAGGSWLLQGNNTLASGETFGVAGTLTIAGTLATAGTISGAAGSKIVLRRAHIAGGTLSSAGAVTVSGASNLLDGSAASLTNQATITVANASALTLEGAIANSGVILLAGAKAATSLIIGSPGVTLSGGGSVFLEASAFNTIIGATANTRLTNAGDRISGSGSIGAGKLVLVNQAAGVIAQMGALALTIDTGTRVVSNAGTIEATGTGGLTVVSAVANTGLLEALGGNLTLSGAVTGGGSAVINAATFIAASAFNEGVTFSGTTGELELANSQTYAGSITGFATTGTTSLDLRDIGFVSVSEATYSGTASHGTLTVTDGTHTAKIALKGDYLGSSWIASSDGAGGVIVVDPAPPPAPPPPSSPSPPAFISAMAGMGGGGASIRWAVAEGWREPSPNIVAPRLQIY